MATLNTVLSFPPKKSTTVSFHDSICFRSGGIGRQHKKIQDISGGQLPPRPVKKTCYVKCHDPEKCVLRITTWLFPGAADNETIGERWLLPSDSHFSHSTVNQKKKATVKRRPGQNPETGHRTTPLAFLCFFAPKYWGRGGTFFARHPGTICLR